jgi:hypothetical protein
MTEIEIKNSTVLRVVKTDTLLFEYVMLPIQDLSSKYLYRFVEPVATAWVEGPGILLFDSMGINRPLEESLRKHAMKLWYQMIDDIPGDWPADAAWLRHMTGVKLRECHIVPKE